MELRRSTGVCSLVVDSWVRGREYSSPPRGLPHAADAQKSLELALSKMSLLEEMIAAQPPATAARVKRCAKSVLRYFASASRKVSKRPYRDVA